MSDGRKRLTREQRLEQLLAVSRQVIAEEGSDALSLGRLADAAGITKPTVYDHFGTREGLLTALYRDFEASGDTVLQALHDELAAYPAPPHDESTSCDMVLIPVQLQTELGVCSLIGTITVFGTPVDVTLSELALETFFPADADSARILRQLSGAGG